MIRKSLLLISLAASVLLGWGNEGHKLINKKAIDLLPAEMSDFMKYQDYISMHAPDPDDRKKEDSTEPNKHYIDIDFYKEYNNGTLLRNKEELHKIYGDSVNTLGVLPWATIETFNNLSKAFVERDRDKVLILAADLGHYVADGHQPMHTMVNYNGQLSGQKGIHMRYEVEMVDKYLDQLVNNYTNCSVKKIDEPLEFVFGYISNSNSVAEVIYDADLDLLQKYSVNQDEYLRLLWFRTNYITKILINTAAEDFASLLYTAWLNAGKPSLNELN